MLCIAFDDFSLEPAGLDFGEIQNIVNELEQAFSADKDGTQEGSLLFGQVLFGQQFAESDNGVHGCSYFMTHIRKKFTLGFIGFIGLLGHEVRSFNGQLKLEVGRFQFRSSFIDRFFEVVTMLHEFHLCLDTLFHFLLDFIKHQVEGVDQGADFII